MPALLRHLDFQKLGLGIVGTFSSGFYGKWMRSVVHLVIVWSALAIARIEFWMFSVDLFRQYLKTAADFLAVAAPILCLFDCVVLPVLSALLPFLGLQNVIHGLNDQLISIMVLAICLPVLLPGVMKHRDKRVLVMFSMAACLMFFTNILGENIDIALHTTLTVLTSALLLRATWLNKRLLACGCGRSHKHGS